MLWTPKNNGRSEIYLGEYVDFPAIIHGFVKASVDVPLNIVQLSVIRALHNLNGFVTSYLVSVSGREGSHEGIVGFEIGVANGKDFHYLDSTMTEKLSVLTVQEELPTKLDFLVIVTYHYYRRAERIPLHFDYHQLRFGFNANVFELRLFHSKGTRRMPLDEFIYCILDVINEELNKQSLKPLIIQTIRVL